MASELFGHERGAFTGALERRRGRFELAAGGTVFLDEVGELPPPVQVALLRVLQEREFERVGGAETLRTDARVVAASNRNLEEAVREGRFRSDLFFRLNVFPIQVPPLRARADDIPLIAEYLVRQYARKVGKAIKGIDESAMAVLCGYQWPGNIRELQNVVERAVILARGSLLGLSDFELPSLAAEPEAVRPARAGAADERQQIEEALKASRGRVYGDGGAAEALGVPPSTLESRIRRLGIDKHAFQPPRLRPASPKALSGSTAGGRRLCDPKWRPTGAETPFVSQQNQSPPPTPVCHLSLDSPSSRRGRCRRAPSGPRRRAPGSSWSRRGGAGRR